MPRSFSCDLSDGDVGIGEQRLGDLNSVVGQLRRTIDAPKSFRERGENLQTRSTLILLILDIALDSSQCWRWNSSQPDMPVLSGITLIDVSTERMHKDPLCGLPFKWDWQLKALQSTWAQTTYFLFLAV
jgi:hypothetical protein